MTQAWTIIDGTTREVIYSCYQTADDQHPVDDGYVAGDNVEFIPLDFVPVPGHHIWDGEQWIVDPEAIKSQLIKRVNSSLNETFGKGFTVPTGPLAGKTLQLRDIEDRTNWLTSQAAYSAQVSLGNGAVMGASFRTEDNETIVVTFAEGLEVLLLMAAWGAEVFGTSWAKKDAIRAGDVTVVPEEGWP